MEGVGSHGTRPWPLPHLPGPSLSCYWEGAGNEMGLFSEGGIVCFLSFSEFFIPHTNSIFLLLLKIPRFIFFFVVGGGGFGGGAFVIP